MVLGPQSNPHHSEILVHVLPGDSVAGFRDHYVTLLFQKTGISASGVKQTDPFPFALCEQQLVLIRLTISEVILNGKTVLVTSHFVGQT